MIVACPNMVLMVSRPAIESTPAGYMQYKSWLWCTHRMQVHLHIHMHVHTCTSTLLVCLVASRLATPSPVSSAGRRDGSSLRTTPWNTSCRNRLDVLVWCIGLCLSEASGKSQLCYLVYVCLQVQISNRIIPGVTIKNVEQHIKVEWRHTRHMYKYAASYVTA